MAFSVKLKGYSHHHDLLLELEPGWWRERELMADPRFVESIDNGYSDFDADLSVAETRELHEKYREKAHEGYAETREALDQALDEYAAEYSHFHVQVFEWETGLG